MCTKPVLIRIIQISLAPQLTFLHLEHVIADDAVGLLGDGVFDRGPFFTLFSLWLRFPNLIFFKFVRNFPWFTLLTGNECSVDSICSGLLEEGNSWCPSPAAGEYGSKIVQSSDISSACAAGPCRCKGLSVMKRNTSYQDITRRWLFLFHPMYFICNQTTECAFINNTTVMHCSPYWNYIYPSFSPVLIKKNLNLHKYMTAI